AILLVAAPASAQTLPATAPATAPVQGQVSDLNGLPILRVTIRGNTRTSTQLILDQVRSQPGQPYSEDLFALDVRAVSALERFVFVDAARALVANPDGT